MTDTLTRIAGSLVQHGPNSRRVYLMKLDPAGLPGLFEALEALAQDHGYGKIFAKIPGRFEPDFATRGYVREGVVPGYFDAREDAVFLSLYRDPARAVDTRWEGVQEVLRTALTKTPVEPPPLADGRRMEPLEERHCGALSTLYRTVFETYPFPIHDPAYLVETMRSHVVYQGIFEDDRLIAAASAELDREAGAAEMTDFATDPAFTSQGLARRLLHTMTESLPARGIRTAMTIARALSHGMNSTFARCGYRFGGTLVNNTGICGRIESMNIWHRTC